MSERISPDHSALARTEFIARGPILGGPSVVLGPNISPGRLSLVDSGQMGPSLPDMGHNLSLPVRDMEALTLDRVEP